MPELLRRVRDERGFTLVELMAVVMIITILVGIAVASYAFSVSKARESTCKANVRILNEMVVKYHYDTGDLPASLNDLVPNYIQNANSLNCPNTENPYAYDNTTGEVSCPDCGN